MTILQNISLFSLLSHHTDDTEGWETVQRSSRSRLRPQSAGGSRNKSPTPPEGLQRGNHNVSQQYQRTLSDGQVKVAEGPYQDAPLSPVLKVRGQV